MTGPVPQPADRARDARERIRIEERERLIALLLASPGPEPDPLPAGWPPPPASEYEPTGREQSNPLYWYAFNEGIAYAVDIIRGYREWRNLTPDMPLPAGFRDGIDRVVYPDGTVRYE